MSRDNLNGSGASPGISGMVLSLPPYRVDLRQWCAWTGNDPEKIGRVVGSGFRLLGPRQSIYTLAADAVLRLVERYAVDPARVRYLALGTESSTDNSAGAIIVKGMVDSVLEDRGHTRLSRHCEVPEFKHACLGGIYALRGALRFLATDGDDDALAIVVCADKALYGSGSSGEPTQGAGAVALLLEKNPQLARIDLRLSGTASEYRGIDFRKPLGSRPCPGGGTSALDIPVYNGRYSTNCYVDEVQRALENMYQRRGLNPASYVRSVHAVFMHRPYQRMPETGWGLAYLFALAGGDSAAHEELATWCRGAGLAPADVIAEMRTPRELRSLAVQERIQEESFPLSMAVLKAFRQSAEFHGCVLARMTLGAEWMREVGNLYTAALPGWLAAGFCDAARRDIELHGREILAIGYGSGDAADALPLQVVEGWREAAREIRFAEALEDAIDITAEQYAALRAGLCPHGLPAAPDSGFVIERIGHHAGQSFQDAGIEYYRYIN